MNSGDFADWRRASDRSGPLSPPVEQFCGSGLSATRRLTGRLGECKIANTSARSSLDPHHCDREAELKKFSGSNLMNIKEAS
jgi:hypothetical protein